MSTLVFVSSGGITPPVIAGEWSSYSLIWTGVDGSVWDLRDYESGVWALNQDVIGLAWPEFDVYTSDTPARAGRRRRGTRAKERNVEIPIVIESRIDTESWRDTFRRFWKSVHPDQPGTLTVVAPTGETRSIDLYFTPDGDYSYAREPGKDGFAVFTLQFVAEDPYFRGDMIRRSWAQTTQLPFFGADGLLHISSNARLESATIDNPGDVYAWSVWQVTAGSGAVSLTITVNGGAITTPTIPAGKTLIADTDPTSGLSLLGTLNGDGSLSSAVDVSGQMNPWNPQPIPPGTQVPIGFTMIGPGAVSATIQTKYFQGLC